MKKLASLAAVVLALALSAAPQSTYRNGTVRGATLGTSGAGATSAPLPVIAGGQQFSSNCGTVVIGAPSDCPQINIANDASASGDWIITAIEIDPTADFELSHNLGTLPATLTPGLGGAITPACDPDSAGLKGGTVTITSNSSQSPHTVPVTCNATGEPAIIVPETSLSFGTIAPGSTSNGQSATINNTGTADLTVTGVTLATGTHFTIAGGSCAAGCVIAPGMSGSVVATFAPGTNGDLSDALLIAHDAGNVQDDCISPGRGGEQHQAQQDARKHQTLSSLRTIVGRGCERGNVHFSGKVRQPFALVREATQ